jgi:hypothetical protein
MNPVSKEHLDKLDQNLDGIIKVYRHLLSLVRKEREILVSAVLDDLNQNNRAKETTLIRAKQLEAERIEIVKKLALSEGLDAETAKLLDFARHFGGETGDRLRQMHSVLDLLLKRVKEFNRQNEVLVNSALETVTGAMTNIRETISEKRTYQQGGKLQSAQAESGQLVSKEA